MKNLRTGRHHLDPFGHTSLGSSFAMTKRPAHDSHRSLTSFPRCRRQALRVWQDLLRSNDGQGGVRDWGALLVPSCQGCIRVDRVRLIHPIPSKGRQPFPLVMGLII